MVYRFYPPTLDSLRYIATMGWPGFNYFIFKHGVGLVSFHGTDGCTCMSGYIYQHRLISSVLSKIENTHLDFPTDYNLSQNYPNPFNPTTSIDYDLPTDGKVTLKIYDMLGCEVKTLVDEYQESGKYTTSFDAGKLSSGIYIYKIVSGSYSAQKKMLLLK
ncbi:MAG: T9SS type A sorting domain-containing protein [Ignavibacteria bacterium]|nr:T9SS type A sorting domain-containing protein [Ignavibacteria bacterium]